MGKSIERSTITSLLVTVLIKVYINYSKNARYLLKKIAQFGTSHIKNANFVKILQLLNYFALADDVNGVIFLASQEKHVSQ